MPKAFRGGKGRAEPPLTEKQREFDEIDRIDGYGAVIMAKPTTSNSNFPLYSNSKDTVYFVLNNNELKKPITIGAYKDYQITRSIDFDEIRGNHYHVWGNPKIVRNKKTITRKNGDFFDLSERDIELIKIFNDWILRREHK